MNKQLIRNKMKALRLSLEKEQRADMDKDIFNKLVKQTECFDTVLCYVSSQIEVDTRRFLSFLLNNTDKRVLVPRCEKGTNVMYFYHIESLSDIEQGSFGIEEPKINCKRITDFGGNACCIIPALSYDKRGYRTGFGKGFYDRFLSGFNGEKIGICYECCITEKIDNDEYDVRAQKVITDKRIMTFD